MALSIQVENIKCGGCANSIKSGLEADPRIREASVDVAQGLVFVDCGEELRPEVVRKLTGLGYPEVDSVAGAERLKAKAKSFVSCAIGRVK